MTRSDQDEAADLRGVAFHGPHAGSEAPLPPRLSSLGIWFQRIAHQPIALWWAAERAPLHPQIISIIEAWIRQDPNALSTTRESLQIVSAFPAQTYLLRRTDEVLEERISDDEHISRLVDYQGTINLETLCRELRILPTPVSLKAWMAEEQARAQKQMALLQDEVRPLEPGLNDAATEFSAAELAQIRSGKGVGSRAQEKLLTLLKETTADFIRRNQQPSRTAPMSFAEARSMFAMRYSLCMIIYYIKWIQVGRQTGKKLERRVNDVVDMQLAAMGTYFNGVMSLDKDLQFVSKAARDVLRNFGAFVGRDWTLPPGYHEPQDQ